MPWFENPSVVGPEFRDKRKRGRPKRERGRSKRERRRYVSEAAPRFGNLCVYEPSALRKKPSDSRKKLSDSQKKPSDFQKKPSGLRRSRAANTFRKGVPNRGINFKDAYRRFFMYALVTPSGTVSCLMKNSKDHFKLCIKFVNSTVVVRYSRKPSCKKLTTLTESSACLER